MSWTLNPRSHIILGPVAAQPMQRAAADLQAQVEKRTGWRWQIVAGIPPVAGDVVLSIPGDEAPSSPLLPTGPEGISLCTTGTPDAPVIYVTAAAPSVALAAAGKLARTMDLRPGYAAVECLSLRDHPAYPVRGHTYANHMQNTAYDKWSYEDWEEYLTEMAAWGDNIAVLYPLHFGRWPGVLPFDEGPWFASAAHEQEFRRQIEIQKKLPDLCHALGMRYGMWQSVNDIFPQEAILHPELSRHGGCYVCPSIPEARRRIMRAREHLFAMLPAIDVVFFPSKDDGGCPGCPECEPWGSVYEQLVEEQMALARRYHPACTAWLSQQALSAAETDHLLRWLSEKQPDWVEAVGFGPYGEMMSMSVTT